MSFRNRSRLRGMVAAALALLLAVCVPASALAATFPAIVTAQSMPVYVNDHGQVRQATIPQNAVVTVGKVRKGLALISYNGYYCIARVQDMAKYEPAAAQPEAAQPQAGQSERVVSKVATYVFKKPNTKSAHVKIPAGTMMNALAVNGNAVMVERNGVIGYALRQHLLFESEATQSDIDALKQQMSAQQTAQLPSVYDAFKSGKYSTEQLCYLFLIQVMGYNTAAAAGVLANINYESGFKTSINGDGGTSYGLCQWHASRKTRLINYCSQHGVSADSLVGQLAYLKYELENFYPLVHRYLKSVSNTAEGAYEAAYFFCYNFENPTSRESKSVTRGQSAQKTYFPRYASI